VSASSATTLVTSFLLVLLKALNLRQGSCLELACR
jgi:hypothetical protein